MMKKANPVWQLFISIKLTVALLISLAATSIIGTVIPQNQDPRLYFERYGSFIYRLFDLLDLFDMYHSWWFQLLMVALTLNILACSIDRLSSSWKIIFPEKRRFNIDRFKRLRNKQCFRSQGSLARLEKQYRRTAARRFGYVALEKTETGFQIFAEKWRWSRLGVYVVHFSVVLLLLGALVGSILGFEGYVNLPEGETTDSIRLRGTGNVTRLPFVVKLEDFTIRFYENGMPQEYRSSLTILEDGKAVLRKDILVNSPLRYRGINIFQSSWGEMPPQQTRPAPIAQDAAELQFYVKSSAMGYRKTAEIGKPIDLPEGMGKFVLVDFRSSADFMGQDVGAAFVGILTPADGQPTEVLLPIHFPNFDKMRKGAVVISVVHQHQSTPMPSQGERTYYSGLQVTRDPGVWIVYAGFAVMIIGCIVTFFMSHQSVCIEAVAKEKSIWVTVFGTANKNKFGMARNTRELARKLERLQ